MILFTSNKSGEQFNNHYPNKVEVDSLAHFKETVKFDHVMSEFKDNKRANNNFISTDWLFGDIDNTHSDDPKDWVGIKEFNKMFLGYSYYLATSKSHQKEKDGKTARDKYHVYFPIKQLLKEQEVAMWLRKLTTKYPFFDKQVKDAARFFFGNPNSQVYKSTGEKSILTDLYGFILEEEKKEPIPLNFDQGSRNDTMFRWACSLHSNGNSDEEMETFLDTLNRAQSKPLSDREVSTIIKSTHRFDRKEPRKFEEIKEIEHTIFSGLVKVLVGGQVMVYDIEQKQFFNKINGAQKYSHLNTTETKQFGKKTIQVKVEPFVDWFDTQECLEGLVFDPKNKTSPRFFNLFRGFPVEPKTTGSWDIYRHHIQNNICQGDKVLYEFLLDWMAHIIQKPGDKMGIAVAIRGKSGSGKGTFSEVFSRLFGDMFMEISSIDDLVGGFNAHLMNKLLICSDEAMWGGDKKSESRLKNMITSRREEITFKGKDTFESKNHKSFIFTTNEDWVAPVSADDRRYLILDCGDAYLQDHIYFGNLWKEIDNGGLPRLMYDLLNRNISSRDWTKIPMTSAKKEQIELGLDIVSQWLLDSQEANSLAGHPYYICNNETINTSDLFDRFVSYSKYIGYNKIYLSQKGLAKKFNSITGYSVKKSNGKCHYITGNLQQDFKVI